VLAKAVAILLEGWAEANAPMRRLLSAAVGHALDFFTWQSLVETQGLSDEEAADAMLRLILCVASVRMGARRLETKRQSGRRPAR
jgi:hypothetical protein